MAEAFVNVTEGSGKKLHGFDRVIGANTVIDEVVIAGEFHLATYTLSAVGVSGATAASHLMQIMAGASNPVRIRRIIVSQFSAPAAVSAYSFALFRLSTAGTGGTAVTARPNDAADSAAGATGMTLPTVKGTEGVQLWQESTYIGTGAIPPQRRAFEWVALPNAKPLVIPAGTANGIAIKVPSGVAAVTFDITVELVETTF